MHARGHLSHGESIALMRTADPLFLPMHARFRPAAGRASCRARRTSTSPLAWPILAAVPDGDARDLLARFARATVVRPGDVGAIARGIAALSASARAGRERRATWSSLGTAAGTRSARSLACSTR